MDVATRYGEISRWLSPSAKEKVYLAVSRFLLQTRSLSDASALYAAAVDSMRPAFPVATVQQLDVLAFYLVGTAALQEGLEEKLDTMSDMGELDQLRLQQYMERRAKFYETLSNILKKIADTQQSIIQNLK
jgi:hypothetical protein